MDVALDRIDSDAAKVVTRLARHGHAAYLVGGCVRDLLLGRIPKDFDVATSATPNSVKALFRNCRIIGRRFRLAHVVFGGAKIIETSTFRANPREVEGGAAEPPAPDGELLIRRDNVFGTAEEDARRRDFTINGLFYDIEKDEVIDYVGGLADLTARLVRTIGEPDIRFREDPVRMLRAIKFAARLDFDIEPATYAALLAQRGEIEKCATARVVEEVYRLLRGGVAARSLELCVETGVLAKLCPELARRVGPAPSLYGLRDEGGDELSVPGDVVGVPGGARELWSLLDALDERVAATGAAPSNGLLVAVLCAPYCAAGLDPAGPRQGEAFAVIDSVLAPIVLGLHVSKRDAEHARQILLAQRRFGPRTGGRRRTSVRREYFADAVVLRILRLAAEDGDPAELQALERLLADADAHSHAENGGHEEAPRGEEGNEAAGEPAGLPARGRRRRRRGGRRRGNAETAPAPAAQDG